MSQVWTPSDWMDWGDWLYEHTGVRPTSELTSELIEHGLLDLVVQCLESPLFAMRNFFKTVDKDTGSLVPYEPWVGQTGLHYTIAAQHSLDLPARVCEIKARQVGFTQSNVAEGLHNCFFPNRKSVIMMPDQDVLDENSPRIGAIINNLPPWLTLMRRIENKNQWEFENPNARERSTDPGQSSTLTLTIPSAYRGAPGINYVCFSEFAHYDNAFEIMKSVMNALGKSKGTTCTIDTTPNGYDPVYQPLVEKIVHQNPQWCAWWERQYTKADIINGKLGMPDRPQGWVPWFVGWWQHEQYTTKDESPFGMLPKMRPEDLKMLLEGRKGEERIGTVDAYGGDEETWLMRRFGISPYRIWFRRFAIDEVAAFDWRYKLLTFHQEMATTWEDCFVDYGLTPFDPIGLDVIRRQVKPPLVRGRLEKRYDEHGFLRIGVDTDFHSEFMEWRIWAMPQDGEHYILAIDPAYAWESDDADWTVGQILRRRDEKLVATFDARVPPHIIYEQIMLGWEFFNRPFTAIETEEGQGYAYVHELYKMGLTNQYRWRRIDTDVVDSTKFLGWQSDSRTKPVMYGTLVKSISDLAVWSKLPPAERDATPPPLCIRDHKTSIELAQCKRRADGEIKAAGRGHDDTVTALMIALVVNRMPESGPAIPRRASIAAEMNPLIEKYGYPGASLPGSERQSERFEERPMRA